MWEWNSNLYRKLSALCALSKTELNARSHTPFLKIIKDAQKRVNTTNFIYLANNLFKPAFADETDNGDLNSDSGSNKDTALQKASRVNTPLFFVLLYFDAILKDAETFIISNLSKRDMVQLPYMFTIQNPCKPAFYDVCTEVYETITRK
jgi:hypothetical protein